jgi:CPA1 family monovalent cation:H+ antiporter
MLVAAGIVLSLVGLMINGIDQIHFDSKLIIDFVIPPLIFEAMMRIDYKDFMRVKISVLLLATIGVVVTTVNVFCASAVSNRFYLCCFDFSY